MKQSEELTNTKIKFDGITLVSGYNTNYPIINDIFKSNALNIKSKEKCPTTIKDTIYNRFKELIPKLRMHSIYEPIAQIKDIINYTAENNILICNHIDYALHPKDQLELVEILVLLHIHFDTCILIYSYSPYTINSLEVFSELNNIAHKCNYYLAEQNDKNNTHITDCTENTAVMYKPLAEPFNKLMQLEHSDREA